MIKKKRKKNPYLYEYGYHFTEYRNLNSILKQGLKIRRNRYEPFYNFTAPIYFVTSLNDFVIDRFPYLHKRYYTLKVNVEKFNQQIDINTLIFDMNFVNNNWFFIYSKKDTPSKLKYWVKHFNNEIPISELQTNRKLITDIITTTHSFTITENIDPEYIEEIYETVLDWKTGQITFQKALL